MGSSPSYDAKTFTLETLFTDGFLNTGNIDNIEMLRHIHQLIRETPKEHPIFEKLRSSLKQPSAFLMECCRAYRAFFNVIMGMIYERFDHIKLAINRYETACGVAYGMSTWKIKTFVDECAAGMANKRTLYQSNEELKVLLNDTKQYQKLETLLKSEEYTWADMIALRHDLTELVIKEKEKMPIAAVLLNVINQIEIQKHGSLQNHAQRSLCSGTA